MALRGKYHKLQSSSLVEQFENRRGSDLSLQDVEDSCGMITPADWCVVSL
jgi:hypothetical protein